MSQRPSDSVQMHFGDHLEELRHRLLLGLLGVAIACGLSLWLGRQIVAWVCLPLLQAQRAADVATGTYTLSPIAGFAVYIKVSLVTAIILASPWVLYHLWRFFESGLYPRERRTVLLIAPFSAGMTALGLLFMYHVLLPVCLWFLISFATSFPIVDASESATILGAMNTGSTPPITGPADTGDTQTEPTLALPIMDRQPPFPVEGQVWLDGPGRQLRIHIGGQWHAVALKSPTLISPLIEIGQYINFVAVLALGIVVAFQLPVIMLIIGWWQLIDPQRVAQHRKYCVFVCFAAGMLLTPSDILSMVLLAVPLWALFEFGLLLMRATYRNRPDRITRA